MIDALDTQRVNAAVHLATRRAVSEMPTVANRQALELSIGRRLQGTYGAQMRALAAQDPDLSVADLAERVIFAAEYPDDTPAASAYSGDRDAARKSRPNAPSPLDEPPESLTTAVIWCAGVLAAKASLSEPVAREPEPEVDADLGYAAEFVGLREALARGREDGSSGRKVRLERAKESA